VKPWDVAGEEDVEEEEKKLPPLYHKYSSNMRTGEEQKCTLYKYSYQTNARA